MKTNFTKRLLGACRQVVMACVMISAIGISDVAAQTCTTDSNTTLDPETCQATIALSSLASAEATIIFSVKLDKAAAGVAAGEIVDPEIIMGGASVIIATPGSYTYQVDSESGCWGTFNVEDKSGPSCIVPDGDLSTDADYIVGGVSQELGSLEDDLATEVVDCNTSAETIALYFDELELDDFDDCTSVVSIRSEMEKIEGCNLDVNALGTPEFGAPTIPAGFMICGIYKKTWFAKDGSTPVKESEGCSQYVYTVRPIDADVQIPNSVTVDCDATDAEIEAMTGAFFLGLNDVRNDLPNGEKVCKIIASVEYGPKLPTCGKGYKQVNTWTVIDWCEDPIDPIVEIQVVEVVDEDAPVITTAGTVSFNSDPFDCSGSVVAGAATATDNCSGDDLTWTTRMSYESTGHGGGANTITQVLSSNGGEFFNVPAGVEVTISWTALDPCGNVSDEVDAAVTTEDNRAPVAICNDELNVSLVATNDGPKARIYAEDLDDTSRDNCGIVSKQVRLEGGVYADFVTVGCSDLGTVTVYLQVTDAAGNTNICWTQVKVEDKSVPLVTPPADLTITCNDERPARQEPVIVAQGCDPPTVEFVNEVNVGEVCGVDTLTRTWLVTPPANSSHSNAVPYTISQKIFVEADEPEWTMIFPDDLSLVCRDNQPIAIPDALTLSDILIENNGCDDWRLNVEEKEYFGADATSCYKIVRTYTLANWCTVENITKDPLIITDLEVDQDDEGQLQIFGQLPILSLSLQEYGKFSFNQVIKINDESNPTASVTATPDCDDNSSDCGGGSIAVSVTADDNCSTPTIVSIVVTGNGSTFSDTTPEDGTYNVTGLEAGTYTVTSTVVDGCGNVGVDSEVVEVIGDCKKPTPIGVVTFTALMENDSVDVWVSDIETSSYDNCTTRENLKFGVELLEDTNNDGQFTIADASATMPTAQAVTLTCDKIATSMLALWVMDEAGNTQVAIIPIGVSDNDNSCNQGGAAAAIAGNITNENDEDIDQVMVKFTSSGQSLAEQIFSGNFNFSVPMATDLTITPEKDLGYGNGVSTADLVKLQRHILGISSLSSAYQMIAADVNSDERVNTKDMLHISRLVLGLYDELPNSTSWKFVSKDHVFSNPSSPWGFPQAMNYTELESDVQADFVGIKIGDLTGNASPSKLVGDDNSIVGEMTISVDETTLTPGQATVVEFKAADFTDFAGYQFTISLGQNVQLTQVTPGVLPNMTEANNFGLNRLSEGTITTSWSNANGITLEDGAVLFSITIESSEAVNLSEVISVNSKQTAAEAYNNDLDVHTVGVQFNRAEDASFQLFQNQPNPFDGETMIGFNLPEAGVATLKVMNVAGQVLITRTADAVRGYNQISLNKSDLNTSGVLYYQIETENHSATKKMVILE